MKVIYKYRLDITDHQRVLMPRFANLLCVAEQRSDLMLWALVDPQAALDSREIRIVGTGNPIPNASELKHIGSVVMSNSVFVWHVFEVIQ